MEAPQHFQNLQTLCMPARKRAYDTGPFFSAVTRGGFWYATHPTCKGSVDIALVARITVHHELHWAIKALALWDDQADPFSSKWRLYSFAIFIFD